MYDYPLIFLEKKNPNFRAYYFPLIKLLHVIFLEFGLSNLSNSSI
jgi:hypothetical protein